MKFTPKFNTPKFNTPKFNTPKFNTKKIAHQVVHNSARVARNTKKEVGKKMENTKKEVGKKMENIKEWKNLIIQMITKVTKTGKDLISEEKKEGGIFYDFNLLQNSALIAYAAFFLSKSYKFSEDQHKHLNQKKTDFTKNKIFASYANDIYIPKDNNQFPKNLFKYFEQEARVVGNNKVLIPVHAIFIDHENQKIILAIRGTASPNDAIIDAAAITDNILLSNNKSYCVHSGFLNAANLIANERYDDLTDELRKNPGYSLNITGHSLGGAIATVTGILLFDKYFKKKQPVNVYGFAAGTSFCAEKDETTLKKYLIDNPNLKITIFIYEKDVVPRLSLFELFVFLATCVSICKLVFLKQNINLYTDDPINDEMYKKFLLKNSTLKTLIDTSKLTKRTIKQASKAREKVYNKSSQVVNRIGNKGNLYKRKFTQRRQEGGDNDNILKLINKIHLKIYSSLKNKYKNNGQFWKTHTTHPGNIYQYIKNFGWRLINPNHLRLEMNLQNIKYHSMGNYNKDIVMGGGRKRRKRRTKRRKTKRRKTKRRKRRKKHFTRRK